MHPVEIKARSFLGRGGEVSGFYYQSFVKHFPKLYIDMAQTVGYFCLFTCTKVKALELLELRNSFG